MSDQLQPRALNPVDAVMTIEAPDGDYTEEETLAAWQYLLDTGIVWSLQGWYGRTARDLLAAGKIQRKAK